METYKRNFDQTLHVRTLGGLLNETFVVYGKQFWQFIRLVAVVQVPVGMLALIQLDNMAIYVAVNLMTLFALMCAFGAMVRAVGQHYLGGEVDIFTCYSDVWRRVISVGVFGIAVGCVGLVLTYLGMSVLTGQSLADVVFIAVGVPILLLIIYSAAAPQIVITENLNAFNAIKRSYLLVKGSWWRVFGVSLVVVLVITGMGILLTIPFAWVSDLAGLVNPKTLAGLSLTTFNSIVVGVAVLPIAFTAMTLLYYDLRVRREHFSLEVLSQEMEVAST